MRRIIDCRCSDFLNMTRRDLLDSIAQCEGRTVCCETVGTLQAMLGDVTNAEFAAAMGADLILLNMFDCNDPQAASYSRSPRELRSDAYAMAATIESVPCVKSPARSVS